MSALDPADIAGVAEVARRAGASPATVHSWRRRHVDFPAPAAELASGPVWDWREVAAWVARHRARPAGRPVSQGR